MKKYEIWIGFYSLGQGYDNPTEPEMVSEEVAISFDVACLKYELKSSLASIEKQEKEGYVYSKGFSYNPETNSNSWTGKYYQSKEEALKSFEGRNIENPPVSLKWQKINSDGTVTEFMYKKSDE